MKRYLNYFGLMVGIAGMAIFTSCQDEDFGYTYAEVHKGALDRDYVANFIARYGVPNPDNDWGFGEMTTFPASPGALTRSYNAGGGAVADAQRSTWATGLNNQVYIPGWPNFDGYYYGSQGGGSTLNNISKTPNGQPIGDVTEYEIQYVSAWFRTHKIENPEEYRENLHVSDFFLQQVSQDDDQVEYRVPCDGGVIGKNGANGNVSQKLHNMYFRNFNSGAGETVDSNWGHLSNFDGSNAAFNPEEGTAKSNKARAIQYVHSGGTEYFACMHSNSDGYQYNWVLVRLTWEEKGADNEYHKREGFYLAFDYETDKTNHKGDGYFSNWIIKISPATLKGDPTPAPDDPIPTPPYKVTRVMCEDLGNTYDFDFNDVVFDVGFEDAEGGKKTAVINLLAAGGTMPIYVGKNPADMSELDKKQYEVHHLLGHDIPVDGPALPINVDASDNQGKLITGSTAIYRIGGYGDADADLIDIYVVDKDGKAYCIEKSHKPADQEGYSPGDWKDDHYVPHTTTNKVPQKFGTIQGVMWMKECKFIEQGYPDFQDWIKNGDGDNEHAWRGWYRTDRWAPEYIHEEGLVWKNGSPTEGNGSYLGMKIELTPNTDKDICSIDNGLLLLQKWQGQAPIRLHLDNISDNDYFTITVVYDKDPGRGTVLPVNGTTKEDLIDNITKYNVNQESLNMYAATPLYLNQVSYGENDTPTYTEGTTPSGYTHKITYKKTAAVNGDQYCDYLVVFLANNENNAKITHMYISYDSEFPTESSNPAPSAN